MQQAIHQGSILVSRGWVHGQTGWLVDHDQVLVFKEHIEIHRLGFEVRQRFWRWHPELHLVSLSQGSFGFPRLAIHPHISSINELLDPRPALLRPLTDQPAIQRIGSGLGYVSVSRSPSPSPKPCVNTSSGKGGLTRPWPSTLKPPPVPAIPKQSSPTAIAGNHRATAAPSVPYRRRYGVRPLLPTKTLDPRSAQTPVCHIAVQGRTKPPRKPPVPATRSTISRTPEPPTHRHRPPVRCHHKGPNAAPPVDHPSGWQNTRSIEQVQILAQPHPAQGAGHASPTGTRHHLFLTRRLIKADFPTLGNPRVRARTARGRIPRVFRRSLS